MAICGDENEPKTNRHPRRQTGGRRRVGNPRVPGEPRVLIELVGQARGSDHAGRATAEVSGQNRPRLEGTQ